MIDSHTHLDHGPAPEDELVAAARAAGVRRILTIGMDSASCRAALDAADRHEEVYAAVGRHPNVAEGYDDAVTAELRELGQLRRRDVVEALGAVGVAADGGEDLLVAVGRGERRAAALGVHADREDAVDARFARGGDQLVLGRGAVIEVGVGVDHQWCIP